MEEKHQQGHSDCIKVVLFGPESTGKSTLAQQLAAHYNTNFVPEYSRIYAELKLLCKEKLTKNDVLDIAHGQLKLETELIPKANKIIFCDTDLLETKVYSEMYYNGFCPPQLEDFAKKKTCDLYLLTSVDMPWVSDLIRDNPNARNEQFFKFESALKMYQKPYEIIKGNYTERFETAVTFVDTLLNTSK